ncbi:uncharacterized protein LOC141685792 [Apium graveolens]|uniref:uncharacterized protein LOC141685792 n=1 Tax=Apium graveolens TaxID=4045 RepID=UPI003D79335A
MAEDYNIDLAKDALIRGASFFLEKPLISSHLTMLWNHIVWITGTILTKEKNRTFINSDEGNGKQKKSRTTQGPNHFKEHLEWKSLPSNPSMTPPSTNYVGFTLEGVQQKLNKISGALQVLNQEKSGHLAKGVYRNGNVVSNYGKEQLGGKTGGDQIFLEKGHVIPINDSVMGTFQVPNQEVSVDLGREMHFYENGIIMNTESRQVASTNADYMTDALHVPNKEPSHDLAKWIYYNNENVIGNNGSHHAGDKIVDQVIPTNGCGFSSLEVPNQEGLGDLDGGVYSNGNLITNPRSFQLGGEIGGGTNTFSTGALDVPNQEASPDLGGGAQKFIEGGYQYIGVNSDPEDRAEAKITDDDIDEWLRMVYDTEANSNT